MFIVIFIATLLILVVSHEFGHFLAAKKFGVKVLEFGFGLPPRIWGKQIGETMVSLNFLPIGGFVKLLGEDETKKDILNNPRSFAAQKVEKRMAIVVAGVLMNLLLAQVLFYIILIAQNFRIIYPTLEPVAVVTEVEPGFPAAGAGIKPGERIVEIDGKPVKSADEAVTLIRSKPELKIKLTVADINGQNRRVVEVIPKAVSPGEGRIGVAFSPIPLKQYNTPLEKIFSAPTYSWDLTKLTFTGLGMLLQDMTHKNFDKASKSVAGPVGLAAVTKDITGLGKDAVLPYIWFMGIISLSLAIFNLLPIPALDGGRLFFLGLEFVTRRRVNPEFERWVHTVGMAVLIGLIVLITYSDIKKFF